MAKEQNTPTKFSICLNGLIGIIIAFFFCVFIICPLIIELIVLSYQTSFYDKQMTLLICGTIQTIVAMWGGYKLGIFVREMHDVDDEYVEREKCTKIWCTPITNIRSILSAGYVVYSLSSWILTNIIASWVVSYKQVMPWYIHLMVYMSLIVYVPFLAIGYATQKAIEECELNDV